MQDNPNQTFAWDDSSGELTCYNEVVALIQEAIDATLREDLVRVEEEIVNWRKSAWV